MKLEVGMYAYSKHSRDYGIGKIVKIHTNGFTHQEVEIQYKDVKISTRYDYVIASHNIIDLIEIGDYVNGLLVIDKYYDYANKEWRLNDRNGLICTEKDIKSIVTKEQFESMQYEVK